jgi:hypothetical protein
MYTLHPDALAVCLLLFVSVFSMKQILHLRHIQQGVLLLAMARVRMAHVWCSRSLNRFYDNAHKLDALDFFKRFAVSPDDLPDAVRGTDCANAGCVRWVLPCCVAMVCEWRDAYHAVSAICMLHWLAEKQKQESES